MLAFAWEEGGELLRPMAAAAISGLAVELTVALFLVPLLYTWLARRDSPPITPIPATPKQ